MLSKGQFVKELQARDTLPMLEAPVMYRLRFCKRGDAQYISHLDLQRTIMRVLTRAAIPMWYTEGFNPHPKVVFALPLSVGTESVCEFLDLKINRQISCEEVMTRLNLQLTDDMRILEVYQPETKFQDIGFADYSIRALWPDLPENPVPFIHSILTASPLLITKKSKSGPKTFDAVPLIADFECHTEEKALCLHMRLAASPDEYLNPELLLAAVRDRCGLKEEDPGCETHSIMREEVFCKDAKTVFR